MSLSKRKCRYSNNCLHCEKVKDLLKQKVAQNVIITLGYFIFSKNHNEPSKVAQLAKIAQLGHPAVEHYWGRSNPGTTTFSIMTLSITALTIKGVFVTFSITTFGIMTLSITVLFLNVIMLRVTYYSLLSRMWLCWVLLCRMTLCWMSWCSYTSSQTLG